MPTPSAQYLCPLVCFRPKSVILKKRANFRYRRSQAGMVKNTNLRPLIMQKSPNKRSKVQKRHFLHGVLSCTQLEVTGDCSTPGAPTEDRLHAQE